MKMITLLLLALIAGYGTIAYGQNASAGVKECLITFTINNAGLPVAGTLNAMVDHVQFEGVMVEQLTARALPETIQTGIDIRDKHLKRSDYFDIAHYPAITIRAVRVYQKRRNGFTATFQLTIKNITRNVEIPFKVYQKNDDILYRGNFNINRLDYNLGDESMLLDKIVNVTITAKASANVMKLSAQQ